MRETNGPAVFLAQFIGRGAALRSPRHAGNMGCREAFVGVQMPTFDARIFDHRAARPRVTPIVDEITGLAGAIGLVHHRALHAPPGPSVGRHPAYDLNLDVLAPPAVRGEPAARAWPGRRDQLMLQAKPRPRGSA